MSSESFTKQLESLIGDGLLAAAFVTYVGVFDYRTRKVWVYFSNPISDVPWEHGCDANKGCELDGIVCVALKFMFAFACARLNPPTNATPAVAFGGVAFDLNGHRGSLPPRAVSQAVPQHGQAEA